MREFVDLHCHSTYSLLDAFGTPMQLAERAKEIGRKAIAITDHGSISGWVQFNKACLAKDIKPIFGYEAYIVDSTKAVKEEKDRKRNHITLLAENSDGYKNLLRLSSLAYDNFYYFPIIDLEILSQNATGVIALSGCWSGKLQKMLVEADMQGAEKYVQNMQKVFRDRFYLETQHYDLHKQTFEKLKFLSNKYSIPIVLTCDAHYLQLDQSYIQETLHAIRDRRFYDDTKKIEGACQWEAEALFECATEKFGGDWNKIFQNVVDVANRCNAIPEKGHFPIFVPRDEDAKLTSKQIMIKRCKEGIERVGLKGAGKIYNDRLKKELALIESKGFIDYILIAADLIEWAKENGVLTGSGRGSSAGSLVCYLLGITSLDPIQYDLLFERFIDETRTDPPDIDTDFEALRRDWVKEYAKKKYGEGNVCDVATFAKFKGKNSLDEIGRIYQIPRAKIEIIKGFLVERSGGDMRSELTLQDTFEMSSETKEVAKEYPKILDACLLEGQLRHLSVHAAGVLISSRPLQEVLGIYRKEDKEDNVSRSVSSFEMKDVSELGLIKIDFLGLTELSILREIYEMAGKPMLDIYNIPLDDHATLEAFKRMEVEGVFQYEGDSTKSVLRQMPDVDFEQLIACLTLSKPGPAHSGSTSRYIAKMRGDDTVEGFDWHPILAGITSKTYGQMIYQEQIIRVLRDFANFTATDANKIRNLIAKSKGEQEFQRYYPIFEKEVVEKVSNPSRAKHLWESIKVFGRYAFNRCLSGDTLIRLANNNQHRAIEQPLSKLYEDLEEHPNKWYKKHKTKILTLYEDGRIKPQRIKRIYKNGVKEVYELVLEDRKIKATLEHRFLTSNGWKILKDIKADDFVIVDGGYGSECETEKKKQWHKCHISEQRRVIEINYVGREMTYDIEMESIHNFVANGIVTHNSHAASYALLGYWSMYMKVHYTDFFYICKLNFETDDKKRSRLLMEANRLGYEILPPLLGKSKVKWSLEGGNGLRAGLAEVKGIGEKTAALLVSENYCSRDDFKNRKTKGITITAFKSLEACHGFQDDQPLEDYFGIHAYDSLNSLVPDRILLEGVRDWDKAYSIVTAGRFVEMNYKDIFEERTSRGQSTDNIKDPDKAKYAMLLLEDETDRCLVHIDRFLWSKIGDNIWKIYKENKLIRVEGIKVDGWRMIRAKKITVCSKKKNDS
jgi:DNA polymerase-3 subunit alpha